MNSVTPSSSLFNSVKQFNILSKSNVRKTSFRFRKKHTTVLADLYFKHEDEPDFDCEFLPTISQNILEKI